MFKKLFLVVALLLGLALIAAPAYATLIYVEPDFWEADENPTCSDIGCAGADFEFDPPVAGTFSFGGATIEITLSNPIDGQWREFKWEITEGSLDLCAVIAKGGPSANVYWYNSYGPFEVGDYAEGLRAPNNPAGQWPGLSHIDFCYNSVPEPATMLLLGTGLIALGLWGWGRKRSKARS